MYATNISYPLIRTCTLQQRVVVDDLRCSKEYHTRVYTVNTHKQMAVAKSSIDTKLVPSKQVLALSPQ